MIDEETLRIMKEKGTEAYGSSNPKEARLGLFVVKLLHERDELLKEIQALDGGESRPGE